MELPGRYVHARTSAVGHAPPLPVEFEPTTDRFDPKTDVRVTHAAWEHRSLGKPAFDTIVGRVDFVCYNCHLWQHTPVSMATHVQPWLWAANNAMDFSGLSPSAAAAARLEPHDARGVWYADLAALLAAERSAGGGLAVRLPVVNWHAGNTHASASTADLPSDEDESAAPWSKELEASLDARQRMVLAHGILLVASFWGLLPFGAFLIRSGTDRINTYLAHVGCQVVGVCTVLAGGFLGIHMSSGSLFHPHQLVGCVVLGLAGLQLCSGGLQRLAWLRSCVNSLKRLHDASARVMLMLGWTNITLGLLYAGQRSIWTLGSLVVSASLAGLLLWVWVRWREGNPIMGGVAQRHDRQEVEYRHLKEVEFEDVEA